MMSVVLILVMAYLIGSISFSYVLTKLFANEDIREHGSGNAGATNTQRVLGTGPAVLVLLLDVFKGVISVLIAMWVGFESSILPFVGLMAIFGHNWPVFFRFKGGKGVATTIGVFATLYLLPSIIIGVCAIIVIAITRYVSLGSLIFIIATPFLAVFIGTSISSTLYVGSLIIILALWSHRENIVRLFKGTENKLGRKA